MERFSDNLPKEKERLRLKARRHGLLKSDTPEALF
jgi:hypothetical protein